MKRITLAALLAGLLSVSGAVMAQELKIALIAGKTGALEAYAKETEMGFMMGLEYLTGGKMEINGRKIKVLVKDDQGKPDLAKAALAEAYGDDKVEIAVGTTSSGAALAMLPVAEEYKKVLVVEPAVADAITGEKWNRYIFRTGRNSSQDGLAAAAALMDEANIAFLAQDYAFGRDGVKAFKDSLAAVKSRAKVVHEEYAPQNATDLTAPAQRIFEALKDKPGRKILSVYWAGANPLTKIADMKPERYGIELAAGGNILPVLKGWRNLAGMEGSIYYYYAFPKNKMNDWLVAENQKRLKQPPDFFTAGGFAAASAV
ncbi:MAG TPA: substrate-binding domain-containing protein, partial [Rhodocyclaceae bacterium]|nr:substrate-binding domain-containing protein [Rhodocyclaceae bacterium]